MIINSISAINKELLEWKLNNYCNQFENMNKKIKNNNNQTPGGNQIFFIFLHATTKEARSLFQQVRYSRYRIQR